MSETGERRRRRDVERTVDEGTDAQPTAAPEWLTTTTSPTGARPAAPGSRRAMRLAATSPGGTPEVPGSTVSGWSPVSRAGGAPATPGNGTPAWASAPRTDSQPVRRPVLDSGSGSRVDSREQPAARAVTTATGPQLPAPAEPPVLPNRTAAPSTPAGAQPTTRRTAWGPVPATGAAASPAPAAASPSPAAPPAAPERPASWPSSPARPTTKGAPFPVPGAPGDPAGGAAAPASPAGNGRSHPAAAPAWTSGTRTDGVPPQEAPARPGAAVPPAPPASSAVVAPAPIPRATAAAPASWGTAVPPAPSASSAAAPTAPSPVVAPAPGGWFPTGATRTAGPDAPGSPAAPSAPEPPAQASHVGSWAVTAPQDAPAASSATAPEVTPGAEPETADEHDDAPLLVAGHSPFPSTGVTQVAAAADDEAAAARRHSYTWLHVLVLAVVAFVLGFLIMALWNQGRSGAESGDGDTGAAALVVEAGPPGSSYAA